MHTNDMHKTLNIKPMKIKMICILHMYQSLTMINHYYGWALNMCYSSLANGVIKEYIDYVATDIL